MSNNNAVLPPMDYFLAFEASARLGGFAAASRVLNISETAISRKVRLLEHHYKFKLFIRRHRSIIITVEGQKLLDNITPALSKLRQISSEILSESQNKLVTIAATNSVANLWLIPKLSSFPNDSIKLKMFASDIDEECLNENIDLAILRGNGNWPGYNAEMLFGETIFPVCSPEYWKNHQDRLNLETLSQHRLIGISSKHTEWMDWKIWLSLQNIQVDDITQCLEFNTYPLLVDAALNGLGIALGWGHLVDHLLKNGMLVRPFGDQAVRTQDGYYLLNSKHQSADPAREQVEKWLLSISAERVRYVDRIEDQKIRHFHTQNINE